MDVEALAKKNPLIFIISGVLVVLAAIPSVYFYLQYKKATEQLANPQAFSQEEVTNLVDKISKLIELPEGETPTLATVTDSESLRSQPFFARSQNGDKVLIYTNARKAVLYRPDLNKIIEVAPVNLGENATPSAQTTQSLATLVIRNGTNVVGLTKSIEDALTQKMPSITVVDRGNAIKRDYAESILVDIKGTNQDLAQEVAQVLGVSVGSLPQDESTPSSDFLVIVGSDKQ